MKTKNRFYKLLNIEKLLDVTILSSTETHVKFTMWHNHPGGWKKIRHKEPRWVFFNRILVARKNG